MIDLLLNNLHNLWRDRLCKSWVEKQENSTAQIDGHVFHHVFGSLMRQTTGFRMARNLGHSTEGVAGSEIIASLKIQLKNS